MTNLTNILSKLTALIEKNKAYIVDGSLNRNLLAADARKYDSELLNLLQKDKELKEHFFAATDGGLVFKKDVFLQFVMNKEFLPDSYTKYKIKIGLGAEDGSLLSENGDVVLNWPYKDAILEGGMSKEDENRSEVLFNETLAPDQITRLLDDKVFTNWKRYDIDGEHELDRLKDDDSLIIKGNNLVVLHSLKKRYAGKVKLIYIDPPYNKDNDSFYNDSFSRSTWLTFMKNRLEVAKKLLTPDGIILVQIDITHQHYLGVLMDEVFGTKPTSLIGIKVKSPSGDSSKSKKYLEDVTEYIYAYSMSKQTTNYEPLAIKEIVGEGSKTISQYTKILTSLGTVSKIPNFSFEIGQKSNRTKIDVHSVEGLELENIPTSERNAQTYAANFKKVVRTAKFSGEFLKQFKGKKGVYYFEYTPTRGENAGITQKTYVINGEGLIYLSSYSELIDYDGEQVVAKVEKATNFINDISWQGIANEGGVTLGKGKKPEELVRRIIAWSTRPGDIVLDYHLGSGTTAAVAHKMGRQYIGIEQLYYGDDDPTIRLKNVINGDQSGISKVVEWQGGGSFVFANIMNNSNKFRKRVEAAKSDTDYLELLREATSSSFLSYRVDPKKLNEDEFRKLSATDKRRLLLELIDNNTLYVNYEDINDPIFKVSEKDKEFNKKLYEKN